MIFGFDFSPFVSSTYICRLMFDRSNCSGGCCEYRKKSQRFFRVLSTEKLIPSREQTKMHRASLPLCGLYFSRRRCRGETTARYPGRARTTPRKLFHRDWQGEGRGRILRFLTSWTANGRV